NQMADPMLRGISRAADGGLDPRPKNGSPALSGGSAAPADGFFTQVSYRGAFGTGTSWLAGWTNLDHLGILGDLDAGEVVVTKTCNFNGDGVINIADVIAFLALARENPNDPKVDWDGNGKYQINDAISLLLDIRDGACPDASVQLAGAAEGAGLTVLDLSAEDRAYFEEMLGQMSLTEEEQAAAELILYGAAAPSSLPRAFTLAQNTPNPFNPSTTISFSVPEGRNLHATLRVYDLRGGLVRTLVDGVREAGTYQIFWDGADERGRQLSSGVYFYRLVAGEYSQTRKMVLLK
ncbi:MAG: T9SS type A sorting domain-containing protein, partial [Dehalococcoidales bacterium]|nr:T9SS type A sorting domain-containing protein [Dehalococcoidales bacterium]